MKKNFLCLMGGVLLSLPLLFASCGNGDNALEEIINGGGSGGGSTPAAPTLDLSTVTAATTIQDGYIVTGTLDVANYPVQITIADGATVTLDGVTIAGVHGDDYKWAGITCAGDATIILNDGSTNSLKGFYYNYPGIYVPEGKTLTIKGGTAGTGKLTAQSGEGSGYAWSSAIGAGYEIACGNIEIQGGDITATGGRNAAGIGGGYQSSCGTITISGGTITAKGGLQATGIGSGCKSSCDNITISGGTVDAVGGEQAAAIGSSFNTGSSCGTITITTGVTIVKATKNKASCIGMGDGGATCGAVTIGGTVYWDGSAYQNSGDTYLYTRKLFYPAVTAPSKPFSAVTSTEVGWWLCDDNNVYDINSGYLPSGKTAVALIGYVGDAGSADASSATYRGLALALADASTKYWCSQSSSTCMATQYSDADAAKGDMRGIDNTAELDAHGSHTHAAATAAKSYAASRPDGASAWFLPSLGQWFKMYTAAGGKEEFNAAANLSGDYWSSTENTSYYAFKYNGYFTTNGKNYSALPVRACFAF